MLKKEIDEIKQEKIEEFDRKTCYDQKNLIKESILVNGRYIIPTPLYFGMICKFCKKTFFAQKHNIFCPL